jgi:hypothetical protein
MIKLKAFVKELWFRIGTKPPVFFKWIRNMAASISAFSFTIAQCYTSMPEAFRGFIPDQLLKYLAVATLAMAVIAHLPVPDKKNDTQA